MWGGLGIAEHLLTMLTNAVAPIYNCSKSRLGESRELHRT